MYHSSAAAMLRAPAGVPELPPVDLVAGDRASVLAWLRAVWGRADVAEPLAHASAALAERVGELHDRSSAESVRRATLATSRYLLRMGGRCAPFGMLAGVAPVGFGDMKQARGAGHRVRARASAPWLAAVVERLEGYPELLERLPVVANSVLVVRGNDLVLPYQAQRDPGAARVADVVLRHRRSVRVAVETASAPIRFADLRDKLAADFPVPVDRVTSLLMELVSLRVLVTSLHAPSIVADALGHVVAELHHVGLNDEVAVLAGALQDIHDRMTAHNRLPGRRQRGDLAARMRAVSHGGGHPLALDLRHDARLTLPTEVRREVEHAAGWLTRLSRFPFGTAAWRDYHRRFFERYGQGTLVPLLDVVSDSGIGWPDGYPGTDAAPQPPVSDRDRILLALVQHATARGDAEVVVTTALLDALASDEVRPPPHLEVAVRVLAADEDAVARSRFRVEVVAVSRGVGVLSGRFHDLLGVDRVEVPGNDPDTVAVQLSFPPLDSATAHVARALQVLPRVVSLGEHPVDRAVLTAADLAVGCDAKRMLLAAPALGVRVEAAATHALSLARHTPPLARFIAEIGRAHCAQVTTFDWGAAAHLPFLPRLRRGRVVLSPARWRITAEELPGSNEPLDAWNEALGAWRTRYRVPARVRLSDTELPLDLDDPNHRVLLRTHLTASADAVVTEAGDEGWFGAHEIVVPLTAAVPPAWPTAPTSTLAYVAHPVDELPGDSRVLLACLYGHRERQDSVLVDHVPALLDRLVEQQGTAPWWFTRHRDQIGHHLRLRVALANPLAFGETAGVVSGWFRELHTAGLLHEITYATSHPETGRWGIGATYVAAEEVFRADSQAVLTQLGNTSCADPLMLAAAHSVAIAAAFTGSIDDGMSQLASHTPGTAERRIARLLHQEAMGLCDPADDWAALRARPGGTRLVTAWRERDNALVAYRERAEAGGGDTKSALASLLHAHFLRACGIDPDAEAVVRRLARAAALRWAAR
ncbi:lantibiotic dehydratase [Yinghuangia sp. YIM S09857]|uniref:lantibiotic dehydratase n=1 Tax=Yinghuangia sp. YIM S09857 TaxID=3436929 RepID=UPI003F53983B